MYSLSKFLLNSLSLEKHLNNSLIDKIYNICFIFIDGKVSEGQES